MNRTYRVYSSCESSENAEKGLTAMQVVKHIYQDDGRGYHLEPKMEPVYNDEGEETGEQQVRSSLGLEWDVYFTKPGQQFGAKSLTAWGETEEDAESEFLLSAWENTSWDDSKWFIEAED